MDRFLDEIGKETKKEGIRQERQKGKEGGVTGVIKGEK